MSDAILEPRWRRSEAGPKTDRRSRKTRAALTDALFDLLGEKPLKSISVTELTRLADVNRATFYVHYRDVFDMFDQVKEELLVICGELVDAHAGEIEANAYEGLLGDIFAYFAENENVYSIVAGQNADGGLLGEMIDTVHRHCMAAARPLERVAGSGGEEAQALVDRPALSNALCAYQFIYIAGGVVSVLRRWIEGGRTEPVETMVAAAVSFIGLEQDAVLRKNLRLAG